MTDNGNTAYRFTPEQYLIMQAKTQRFKTLALEWAQLAERQDFDRAAAQMKKHESRMQSDFAGRFDSNGPVEREFQFWWNLAKSLARGLIGGPHEPSDEILAELRDALNDGLAIELAVINNRLLMVDYGAD